VNVKTREAVLHYSMSSKSATTGNMHLSVAVAGDVTEMEMDISIP
jgi:hypothetical protein